MNLSLRSATPADLETIMSLENAGFEKGIVEETKVFAHRVECFPEGFLLASAGDGICVSYLCFEIWDRWSLNDLERFQLGHQLDSYHDSTGDRLYLASMTISPGYRGRGLGRPLVGLAMNHMKLHFPQLSEAVLIVGERWILARRIYESLGFEYSGRIEKFFQPESGSTYDALVMRCRLDETKRMWK